MKITVAGENALIAYFGEGISPDIADTVRAVTQKLSALIGDWLIDLIPSYASLLVVFDPLATDHESVRKFIEQAASRDTAEQGGAGKLIELPVYYSEESGPDLVSLARHKSLSTEEVIDIHTREEYRVYAIGFAPGFAYLGQVDKRIATPRRSTPRKKVPRGAVAIADRQTAVYPSASPGGWNLIGLCPTPMFKPDTEPTMPLSVGDRISFHAVDKEEFLHLGGDLQMELAQ